MINTIPVQTTPSAPFFYRAGLTSSTGGQVLHVDFQEPVLVFWEASPEGWTDKITRPWPEVGASQDTTELKRHEIRSTASITSFPGEAYIVREPIPVMIERLGESDFLARFVQANLAMSGETEQEAFQNLVAEILDAFDALSQERTNLGPEPVRQLDVLDKYLVRQQ